MGGAPNAYIRIAIADDHALIRLAVQRMFAEEPDLEILGSFGDGLSVADFVMRTEPDVVILDQEMPELDGLGVARRLSDAGCSSKIVMLVGGLSDCELVRAIELGVRGLVLKDAPFDAITECVRSVHAGQICIGSAEMMRAYKTRERHALIGSRLTARETEVAMLVGEGLRNREIAGRLRMAEGTVKVHLHSIYAKLGVEGRNALFVAVAVAESL